MSISGRLLLVCDHYWTEDSGYWDSTRHCYQLLATLPPRCVCIHTHSLNVTTLQLILDVNVVFLSVIVEERCWNEDWQLSLLYYRNWFTSHKNPWRNPEIKLLIYLLYCWCDMLTNLSEPVHFWEMEEGVRRLWWLYYHRQLQELKALAFYRLDLLCLQYQSRSLNTYSFQGFHL